MTVIEKHPLAGKTVALNEPFTDHLGGVHTELQLEDWWLNLTGDPWWVSAGNGNLAALYYMNRHEDGDFDEASAVVYGKTGKYGNLFNVEELAV